MGAVSGSSPSSLGCPRTDDSVVFSHAQSLLYSHQSTGVFLAAALEWQVEHVESLILPVLDRLDVEVCCFGRDAEPGIVVAVVIEEAVAEAWSTDGDCCHFAVMTPRWW